MLLIIKTWRHFKGTPYEFVGSFFTKSKAEKTAAEIRKKGGYARVTKGAGKKRDVWMCSYDE